MGVIGCGLKTWKFILHLLSIGYGVLCSKNIFLPVIGCGLSKMDCLCWIRLSLNMVSQT